MSPTDFPLYPDAVKKEELIPALIGAGVCLLLSRIWMFNFFFLVPIGFVAFRCSFQAARFTLLLAVTANALFAFGTALIQGIPATEIFWNILYFTVMAAIFTAIAAPPPLAENLSESVRLFAGSCLASVFLLIMFSRLMASPEFSEGIRIMLNTAISLQSGSDVVQNALLETQAEAVLSFVKSILLRGGSLVSSVLLFVISRQTSLLLSRVPGMNKGAGGQRANSLALFRVKPDVIWILSISLLLAILASLTKMEIAGIILWNILVLCGMLYFAQGLGILQFLLARPSVPPFLRLLLPVLFFLFVISPGINALLLGGVVLLGIAENWVPFRAPKSNGTPSTPEAGDGGNL